MAIAMSELCKEFAFGAAAGLVAGYLSKKAGSAAVAAVGAVSFVAVRAAIFDGHHLATWSPLQRDDPAFGLYLVRRARRETFSVGKRAETFVGENFYILSGFSGGILLTSVIP